jgi:hypothetical protein
MNGTDSLFADILNCQCTIDGVLIVFDVFDCTTFKAHGRKFFRIKEIGRVEVSVPLAVVGIDAIYLDLEIETAVCQVIG